MPNSDSCGGTGGCNGATAELAFEYMQQYGLPQMWTSGYLPEVYNFGYTQTSGTCTRDQSYGGKSSVPRAVTGDGLNFNNNLNP